MEKLISGKELIQKLADKSTNGEGNSNIYKELATKTSNRIEQWVKDEFSYFTWETKKGLDFWYMEFDDFELDLYISNGDFV